MNKTIPIVIPYFRAPEELRKCKEAIEAQNYKPLEIFVHDNSKNNILFTAAVNKGIEQYAYDQDIEFILVLNQDAYLSQNTLIHLLNTMGSRPDCGIACPLQIDAKNGGVYWGGSLDAFPFGKHLSQPIESYKSDFETFWANGAAMLLRTKMIKEIGLLDKNMRFICSDSDYSFTARSRGWKVITSVNAIVYHSSGQSGSAGNTFINQVKIEDAIYFTKKWLTGDVYKTLAYEGQNLTKLKVNGYLQSLEAQLKKS
jgi:GT2 family glycosyltransferase